MNLFYALSRRVLRALAFFLYHHSVQWEFDPKKLVGGAIIAPNHVSYLDPQLVCGSWPGPLSFFAGSRQFEKPVVGLLLRLLCCYPVEKGKELSTIRTAIGLLSEGKRVVVFPEGTRSEDGTLQPLRNGVAFLALQSQCPIVPCYVGGSYEAWPKGQRWPRFRGVTTVCRFGKPISPCDADGTPLSKEALNEQLYDALRRLSSQ